MQYLRVLMTCQLCLVFLTLQSKLICEEGYTCYEDSIGDIIWVKRNKLILYGPTCEGICQYALFNNSHLSGSCNDAQSVNYDLNSFAHIASGLGFTCKTGKCWDGTTSRGIILVTSGNITNKNCYFPKENYNESSICQAVPGNANCYNERYSTICPCINNVTSNSNLTNNATLNTTLNATLNTTLNTTLSNQLTGDNSDKSDKLILIFVITICIILCFILMVITLIYLKLHKNRQTPSTNANEEETASTNVDDAAIDVKQMAKENTPTPPGLAKQDSLKGDGGNNKIEMISPSYSNNYDIYDDGVKRMELEKKESTLSDSMYQNTEQSQHITPNTLTIEGEGNVNATKYS